MINEGNINIVANMESINAILINNPKYLIGA